MDAEVLMAAVLGYARRVAFSMSKDPEMGSIAGFAALRVARTYDSSRGVPIQRWIARITRASVHAFWRRNARSRVSYVSTELLADTIAAPEPPDESGEELLSREDWQLLHDYYMLKWPLDVMARRYGNVSVGNVKRRIAAAVSRLESKLQ